MGLPLRSRFVPALVAALLATGGAGAADPPLLLGATLPPEIAAALPEDGAGALAVSHDGASFAVAVARSGKENRSLVTLFPGGGPASAPIRVNGIVRDLLFAPDGATLFGIVSRPARRGVGSAELLRIDVAEAAARRSIRLPPTAAALDYWSARRALLVAAEDELRTILLPAVRSGALFRVPGRNLSVTALDGGGRVLVGREDGIWRIDLNDRPDDHTMPVRERLQTTQPVVSLATSRDGARTVARLADGSVLEVDVSPLAISAAGRASLVEAVGIKPAPREDLVARAEPEPEPEPPSTPEPEPEPAAPEPETRRPDVEPPVEPPAAPPTDATPPTPPPAGTAPRSAAAEDSQVYGRIAGQAADRVRWVVLLGPDNILTEAKRVEPAADGGWSARGLEPGRYRITLDGGGDRLLVSRPVWVQVEVTAEGSVEAPAFDVLRTR